MKKEEASFILTNIDRRVCDKELNEALDMAIKALEQEPCEDAISRQAVLDAMYALCDTGKNLEENPWRDNLHIDAIADAIDNLPPVTPQPKAGHWIDIMVGDMPAQACDQCNTFYPLAYTGGGHKYCPNCGIKMQEVGK